MTTRTNVSRRAHRFVRATDRVRLVVTDGPDRGASVVVGADPISIGSAGDGLRLTDAAISRQHARVRWLGGALELVDDGSKNGSFVAGCRARQVEIPLGVELRLGSSTLKVISEDEPLDPIAADAERFGAMVAASKVMRQLFTLIEQLARSDVPVLIEGETGVGKELVAEEIHRRSARTTRPFSVFDCSAIPDELVESTLFGHVRGAFPAATEARAGVIDEAEGGTLLLDEIGELALEHQPLLLRLLDRKVIRPVGGTSYRPVNIRLLAATHRDLHERIEAAAFREDLFYRLAVVRVEVPALRERPEDIPLLARHFLDGRCGIDDKTLARLTAYEWPGNVRELRNIIEGAVATSRGDALEVPELGRTPRTSVAPGPSITTRSFRDAKSSAVEAFEKAYLEELVGRFPTLSAAADAAGMDRKHLRVLLRRYGLREE